jgi:hypothetical protein
MLPQFSYSSAEVKRVRKVQFGVLSPEEIVSDNQLLPGDAGACEASQRQGCREEPRLMYAFSCNKRASFSVVLWM